jgi:ElaB/YqjD/DUF883 family membrane-anchored ribosome-binding protein
MSKKRKSKETKPTIEDLNKKIKDVKKLADDSKIALEDKMKSKPLESAAMIFVVGLILGILLGSRRG